MIKRFIKKRIQLKDRNLKSKTLKVTLGTLGILLSVKYLLVQLSLNGWFTHVFRLLFDTSIIVLIDKCVTQNLCNNAGFVLDRHLNTVAWYFVDDIDIVTYLNFMHSIDSGSFYCSSINLQLAVFLECFILLYSKALSFVLLCVLGFQFHTWSFLLIFVHLCLVILQRSFLETRTNRIARNVECALSSLLEPNHGPQKSAII